MLSSILVVVVVVAVALIRAGAETDGAFVEEWGRAHALRLTPTNRPLVWWYLRTARLLRTIGVLAGLFLPGMVGLAITGSSQPAGGFLWPFVGYFVGALYAELSLVRPRGDGPRVAALATREVHEYLPRRLVVGPWVVAGIAVATAIASQVLPADDELGTEPAFGSTLVPVMAMGAAGLCAALPLVERWLVRRPQPWSDPELVAADDAIRSQSLHSVVGSGVAIALSLLGPSLWAVSQSDVPGVGLLEIPAFLCFPGAFVACLYLGHRAWRVPRLLPGRQPPVRTP